MSSNGLFVFSGNTSSSTSSTAATAGAGSGTATLMTKFKPPVTVPISSMGTDAVDLHLLPCAIGHNGHAKVISYFNNRPSSKDPNILESTIRGIKLTGTSVAVPKGYRGIVYRAEDQSPNKFTPLMRFGSFYYWHREKTPSPQDPQQQALKWLDIAQHLHRPITREMMDTEKNKMNVEPAVPDTNKDKIDEKMDQRGQVAASDVPVEATKEQEEPANVAAADETVEELLDDRPLKKLKSLL